MIILSAPGKSPKEKIKYILFFSISYFIVHIIIWLWQDDNIFLNTLKLGFEFSSFEGNYNQSSQFFSLLSAFRWILVLLMVGYFLGLTFNWKKKPVLRISCFLLFFLLLFYFFFSHYTMTIHKFFEYSLAFFSYVTIGIILSTSNENQLNTNKIELLTLIEL